MHTPFLSIHIFQTIWYKDIPVAKYKYVVSVGEFVVPIIDVSLHGARDLHCTTYCTLLNALRVHARRL